MAYSPVRPSLFASLKNFLLFPALFLAGAVFLAGCHPAVKDPTDPKFIVAEKGTWQITRGDLDKEVAALLKQHQVTAEQVGPANMPKVETYALQNMVLKKLILDKAATLQLKDVDKEEAAELDKIKQQIPPGQSFDQLLKTAGLTLDDIKKQIHENVLSQKVLEAEAFKKVDPTEQEIDAIYLQYKDKFNIPEKVRASRILILVDDKTSPADKAAKKKAIDKARERVAHGEDFSKVAMAVSEDRYSAPKGGDIGYFARNENEPGFDDVAFTTKQGQLSPVFLTALGYQFLVVTAIQPPGVVPLADARGYISSKLREQKMKEQATAYTTKLLADSGVTYHIVLVDLAAQGNASSPDNAPPPPSSVPDSSASTPPSPAAATTNAVPGN
ncbi:MAG: peptidylprolyl isomerase [Methylacidiphilales bacterium]|nr:peptidylprolyl isomerase [Candidatus Methylacidiphilales bacterium]